MLQAACMQAHQGCMHVTTNESLQSGAACKSHFVCRHLGMHASDNQFVGTQGCIKPQPMPLCNQRCMQVTSRVCRQSGLHCKSQSAIRAAYTCFTSACMQTWARTTLIIHCVHVVKSNITPAAGKAEQPKIVPQSCVNATRPRLPMKLRNGVI